jgi:hypothetical protein
MKVKDIKVKVIIDSLEAALKLEKLNKLLKECMVNAKELGLNKKMIRVGFKKLILPCEDMEVPPYPQNEIFYENYSGADD